MAAKALIGGVMGLLIGCTGYAETGQLDASAVDTGEQEPKALPPEPEPEPDAALPVPEPQDAGTDADADADASAPVDAGDPAADASLRFSASDDSAYLTDRAGRALYMFANDIPGTDEATCLTGCANDWPPFDADPIVPAPGIVPTELKRFHRLDNLWQVSYKGHPLYYKASDVAPGVVSGDGIDGRWFVARNYLVFVAATTTFAPAGASSFDAVYLTNGFGSTLYVCLDDTPGSPPVSSCTDDECRSRRSPMNVIEGRGTKLFPSIMDADALGAFTRPDKIIQLTYRGWPLYYFVDDLGPGDTRGHNDDAWRAIDPKNFGVDPGTLNQNATTLEGAVQ